VSKYKPLRMLGFIVCMLGISVAIHSEEPCSVKTMKKWADCGKGTFPECKNSNPFPKSAPTSCDPMAVMIAVYSNYFTCEPFSGGIDPNFWTHCVQNIVEDPDGTPVLMQGKCYETQRCALQINEMEVYYCFTLPDFIDPSYSGLWTNIGCIAGIPIPPGDPWPPILGN
jgi:hypothetical protein